MKTVKEILEAVHPMAVHAKSNGPGKGFTITNVGKKVKHVSIGDRVSSSDLDDLTDAGHKVKEV